jgi:type II secretion system protein H
LIELIIVIVIVGIMASLTTINLSDNKQELLQTEAKRFQALFVLARQESVLQSRHLGMRFFQGGYQFYQMLEPEETKDSQLETDKSRGNNDRLSNNGDEEEDEKPKWQNLQDNILRPRNLPDSLFSQLYLEGISVELSSAKTSKPAIENRLSVSEAIKPQIFLLSSGENTAFEYQLNYSGVGRASIKVNPTGKIELTYIYEQQ